MDKKQFQEWETSRLAMEFLHHKKFLEKEVTSSVRKENANPTIEEFVQEYKTAKEQILSILYTEET